MLIREAFIHHLIICVLAETVHGIHFFNNSNSSEMIFRGSEIALLESNLFITESPGREQISIIYSVLGNNNLLSHIS